MSDIQTLIDVAKSNRDAAFAQTQDPRLVEYSAATRLNYQFSEQKDEAGGGGTVATIKTKDATLENRNGVWLTREDAPEPPQSEYVSTETETENGVDYLVGVKADGSRWLIGKDGKQEGVAALIEGPKQPSIIGEITRGIVTGALSGVGEMSKGLSENLGLEPIVQKVDDIFRSVGIEPIITVPKAETAAGQVAQEIGKTGAQMAVAAVPTATAVGALANVGRGVSAATTMLERLAQNAAKLSPQQKSVIIGAAVDAFAFGEPQIVETLKNLPEEWRGPVTDAVTAALEKVQLGKVEDEKAILADVENRIRAAAEGAVLSKSIDGAILAGKTIVQAWKALGMGAAISALVPSDAEAGFTSKAKAAAEAAGQIDKSGSALVQKAGPYVKVRAATTEEEAKVLAQMDLPVVGLDFNFNHVNTIEDVGKLIDGVSEAFKDATLKQTGGVIKHKETLASVREKLADDMGITAAQMVALPNVKPGQMAERITNMRIILASSAKTTADMADKIRLGRATDADRLAFRRQLALHAALQTNFKGIQTDIARALSAFNINIGPEANLNAATVKNLLSEAGGIETTDKLAREYATLYREGGPKAANIYAQKTWAAKLGDSFFEVYINGLLSATGTHVSNVLSNAIFDYGLLPIERGLTAVIGSARRMVDMGADEQAYLGEAMAMYTGLIGGTKDSLRLAWTTLKTETPNDPIGKIEALRHKAISADALELSGPMGKAVDWLGAAVRVPGRFLLAEDEFFKATGYRMELQAQAYRTYRRGLEDGLSKDEALLQAGRVLTDPDPAMRATVEDAARVMTFTNPVEGETLKALNQLHQTPIGKLVVPFLRTPVNVMTRGFERTPVALAMPSFWREIQAGGSRADAAMARLSLGSAISAVVANEVLDGNITGSGPADPDAREIWLKTHQPYSVKVGEQWVSYQRMDPIAIPIALVANMIEVQSVDVHNSRDEENLPVLIAVKFADVMKDKSFFAGIGQMMNAISYPKLYGMDYIASTVGGMVQPIYSAALREAVREIDPLSRNIKPDPNDDAATRLAVHIINSIRARTPGYSTDLATKPDIFGHDRVIRLDQTIENLTGIPIQDMKDDPVVDELLRLGMPIAKPEPQLQGVRLAPDIHSEYVKLAGAEVKIEGKDFHDYLETVFSSPGYQSKLPGDQRGDIRKVYDAYKEQARMLLIKRHPELRADILIETIRKKVE